MDEEELNGGNGAAEIVRPYNLGCGGVVHLLLERRATADSFLHLAQRAFAQREELACATILEGAHIGKRAFADPKLPANEPLLVSCAQDAQRAQHSLIQDVAFQQTVSKVWAEYLPPRCGLFIFGAGDDAQPLVTQASTLGWQITVADGRSHLATRARFPEAHTVHVLEHSDCASLEFRSNDAAVLMTHSFDQDCRLLAQLLAKPLLYLGVLGPRYRTADLITHAVERIGGSVSEWMQKINSPVGLDIGADGPATIALSILAEIQATLNRNRNAAASLPTLKSTRVLNRRAG